MKLSIITINYNNVEGLRRTIDSVLCQTWRDFEWIFIDGGSTDGSKELIERTAAECPNVSYWCSEPDKGVYNAMNKGIAHAQGEYLNFMNSGDTFYDEDILERMVGVLDGTDIIAGTVQITNGRLLSSPKEITAEIFFQDCSLCHQACFIKTSLQKLFPYDETLSIVSDKKFYILSLVLNDATYKAVEDIICEYDTTGISQNIVKLQEETEFVFHQLFSKRVLEMITRHVKGISNEEKLYVMIRHSRLHKSVYNVLVGLLKILSLFKKNECWIKEFSFMH